MQLMNILDNFIGSNFNPVEVKPRSSVRKPNINSLKEDIEKSVPKEEKYLF